jgi:hypothetical protein
VLHVWPFFRICGPPFSLLLPPSLNISILRFLCCTFDHSFYSKNLWKCRNNYDILKI